MVIFIVIGIIAGIGWFIARSRRADRRAGLDAAHPIYRAEPPTRRLGKPGRL